MKKVVMILVAIVIAFSCGYIAGVRKKPTVGSFHDMLVNHPKELHSLITPRDKRVRALAAELKTPENAFVYVRDRIANDPAMTALPAGEILAKGQASCLGKAVLLCSLYRAMGVPSADVRVVTGEVNYPYGIVDHAWVEMEYNGSCIQQDATDLLGNFEFDQFRAMDFTRTYIRKEGYAFNDRHFAIISRLNMLKDTGHPMPD